MTDIRDFKHIWRIPDDILLFTPGTRRGLLCYYINRLDDSDIDELSFQLAASDDLLQAYNGDVPMTGELFRAINNCIANTMHSAHITYILAQRYGLTYCEYISVSSSEEIEKIAIF